MSWTGKHCATKEASPCLSVPWARNARRRAQVGIRSWLDDAGLLVARPSPGATDAIGAAFKGGHNAEHHNHNDLGSFVVALRGKLLLTDPGSELYTSRTFGPNRYDSKILNSYGHSVPLIGGKLQAAAGNATAKVARKAFSDQEDVVVYDLSAAYDVPVLKRLRTLGCHPALDPQEAAQAARELREMVAQASA